MQQNLTLIQFFHWYTQGDSFLWKHFAEQTKYLSKLGITGALLPPATKCNSGKFSVGYDAYDLWDLGEFNQKGGVPTKYGTKLDYITAVRAAHNNNIAVYADAVLNHKAGADELEKMMVRKVNMDNRNEFISEPFEVEAYTKFNFGGRGGKYSQFQWNRDCFSGIDWIKDNDEKAIYSIINESGDDWEENIEDELGNFDYLMYADIDYRNYEVREEVKRWGKWYIKETNVDGFRLDALKHITPRFIKEFIEHVQHSSDKPLFIVGEYWSTFSPNKLFEYLHITGAKLQLFDAPLQNNFHKASRAGNNFDMRTIFDNTLVKNTPLFAVTLVENHDSQPLQALEAPVEQWFKPLAYAIILLRIDGIPMVFYPCLYGASYKDCGKDGNEYEIFLNKVNAIEQLLVARKQFAYGEQHDYFDHSNCVGWTREGIEGMPNSGCAVILSNGNEGYKNMYIGKHFAGKRFIDFTGNRSEENTVNDNGEAIFYCNEGSVSVWVVKQ